MGCRYRFVFVGGFLTVFLAVRSKQRLNRSIMNNTYCSYMKIEKGLYVILAIFLGRERVVGGQRTVPEYEC